MAEASASAPDAAIAADEPILVAEGLTKTYPLASGLLSGTRKVHALTDVSLALSPGETLGIVGESGCGKTTLGKTIMRLMEPDRGRIQIAGEDITHLPRAALRAKRRHIQMVFQDPFASMNPRLSCKRIVAEPLEIHGLAKGERGEVIGEMFERVGLSREQMSRYPHQLSGGQRQRLGIARALALRPSVLVADEPVSALDVSVQAQVLNLLIDLKREFGLAYLFIAHDLAVVEHISHRVAVMYLGKIVETAPKMALFSSPRHPYTEALLDAVPRPVVGRRRERTILRGDVPSPIDPPPGCAFHTRCPIATEVCRKETPRLATVAARHQVACHHRS